MPNRIKGMHDIIQTESERFRLIRDAFFRHAYCFGFAEATTPIVEKTELFSRSIGESTDIVEKEMFTFPDRKGKLLSLRPEGTASMVRAYIENKVYAEDPVAKWAYFGPMYRYERPQKGRNRQFFQLGAEVFGLDAAWADAELISMAWRFFEELGLKEDIRLEINSLGDKEERLAYRETLVAFFEEKKSDLCDDCRRRLKTNPLRVLDCKIERCKEIAVDAPLLVDNLADDSRKHFDIVLNSLENLSIPYTLNKRIVRGLDYYNRTAFEFIGENLGAQDAVGGGGRYDGLVKELNGPKTPAVGFALGVERITILLEQKDFSEEGLDFYFAPLGEAARDKALTLADKLRSEGLRGEVDLTGRRLKHLFARAEKLKAKGIFILGEEELANGVANWKNLATKEQKELALDDINRETVK